MYWNSEKGWKYLEVFSPVYLLNLLKGLKKCLNEMIQGVHFKGNQFYFHAISTKHLNHLNEKEQKQKVRNCYAIPILFQLMDNISHWNLCVQ